MSATEQIVPGIQRWTCPHPEYRTGSEEVVSYALTIGDAVALVDPLLPAEDDARRAPLLADLDALVGAARRLEIMVTIPYHTRSAEVLFERYWGDVATRLWGNAAVRDRFAWDTPLTEIPRGTPGTFADIADGLAHAYTIGNPKRLETPLSSPPSGRWPSATPSSRCPTAACACGTSAPARRPGTESRFLPTLEPLAALEVESVLVTHGPPVTRAGRRALRAALDAPPVTVYW